jgi:hypothetical protein
MASGTLGQASLAAATNTTVYTVGATPSVFNVEITNTTGYTAVVNLAIAAAASPAAGEYLEYQFVLPAGQVLERGGIVATSGKRVVAYSSVAGVNVNVYGYEG